MSFLMSPSIGPKNIYIYGMMHGGKYMEFACTIIIIIDEAEVIRKDYDVKDSLPIKPMRCSQKQKFLFISEMKALIIKFDCIHT